MKLEFFEYKLELNNFKYELDIENRIIVVMVKKGNLFLNDINKAFYKFKSTTNIGLADSKYYYFTNGCIASNYDYTKDELKLTISYDQLMISECEIDIYDLYINKVEYKIEYLSCKEFVKLEDSVGKEIKFEHENCLFKIQNNYTPRYYTITVESKDKIEYNELIEKCDELYQLFSFSLGYYFDVNNIKVFIGTSEIVFYRRLNNIYYSKKIDVHSNFVLVDLKDDLLTKYIKWLEFENRTNLINNVYLTTINQLEFRDLALSKMINLLDGYIRIIKSDDIKQKTKKFRKNNPTGKYGLKNRYTDIVFENKVILKMKDSSKLTMLLDKISNHRNYFSHFYDRKNPFSKYEMDYTLNFLNLIYRVEVLNYLGWKINEIELEKNILKIDK